MRIGDLIQYNHMALPVRVEFPERCSTLLHIDGSLPEHIHKGQTSGRTETRAAVVHDAVGADVLGSHFIHTAAEEENQTCGAWLLRSAIIMIMS